MRFKRSLAVLLVSLCCFVPALIAQSDRASITGTITDSSSAALPNAHVKVTNVDTNAVTEVMTDGHGYYRALNLPIGNYDVTISHDGFKSEDRKGITLQISQVVEIDAALLVGAASEEVSVTGEAPILQTSDPVLSTNISAQAVAELPLNIAGSRNLSNFMFDFVPGVEGSDYSSHIDGSVALSKEVMIDGTSAVSQLGGYISESQPPMEAIQEFEADTSGITADAGRSGGGVFRYEMKSGTNQIHGSLFGFLHDTSLDALSAQAKLNAIESPQNAAAYLTKSDSMSDWGGSFGGALIKDKLFYYFSFERYMQDEWALGPDYNVVPTNAMLGLNADGSQATYADLSPFLTTTNKLGTDPCGNPVYQGAVFNPSTNCVFVNNMIPTSMFSKTSQKIIQLFHQYYQPQVNALQPGNEASHAYGPDPWFHNTQTSIKMDYNLSNANHISGSYYFDDFPRLNADQGGVWSDVAQYGGPMANAYWHNTTAPSVRLSDTHVFTPSVLNEFHATWNRFRNPSDGVSMSGGWPSTLGLTNASVGNFPLIYFDTGMYTNGGNFENGWNFSPLGSQYNDFYAANTFIYNDQVSWTKGRHTMKFGVEFRAMQMNEHPDSGTFNSIHFDPTSTAPQWYNYGGGYNELGSSFASFLLGDVYSASLTAADPEYGRRKTFSVYAIDDFKINPRLTIDMSLRWDYNNPYKELYGRWSSFEAQDWNPVTKELGQEEYLTSGDQSFERRQDWFNFSPHVGAAYRLTEKTVLRGNIGVFYSPLNMNTWGGIPYQQWGNPGYFKQGTENAFNWDTGYNPTFSQVKEPQFTQWGMVSIDPRALTPGNTQQYNIGVQRELTRDMKLDVNWIQSHSYHLQSGYFETNQPTVANMQNYVLNGKFPTSYTDNPYWGYGGPGYQGITPYPQVAVSYSPLFTVGAPLGNADYKSLQVSVTKRTAHGLSLMASYAWSRAHGDVDTSMGELWWVGGLQNTYDLKDEAKDIQDFDMTHIVKGYIMYELPFGRGKWLFSNVNHAANEVIGGWSLDANFHYNTGTPIQVHSTNYYPGFNSVYVNLAPGCSLTNGSYSLGGQYLNMSCFQNPAAGQLGTAGNFISAVRNPGLATEDIGLHKTVGFGPEDRFLLTLRLEFFNVFNRDQLAGPNTNLGDPAHFGLIQGYTPFGGRVGQFGARLTF